MADVRTGTDKIKDEPRVYCFGRKEVLKKSVYWEGLRRDMISQKTLEPA